MDINTRRFAAAGLALSAGVLILAGAATPAAAQSLGTFRWQLQPYCNVVTLAVTQMGSQYRFEGFDDQCGAPARATVTGLGVPNLDGSLEFGWTIVTAAGPQHVDVTFNISSLGGPWRDNGGNTGTLVFNPGSPSGSPRPGGLGAVAINPAQVQQRIVGNCTAGLFVRGVNQDGSVTCGVDGGGDITGVTPGPGLTGGGSSGTVGLAVNFAGSGLATTAARSDHNHTTGGVLNVMVGFNALNAAATGSHNTALGSYALMADTTGNSNVAVGSGALSANTTGSQNVGVGYSALADATSGGGNTAIGMLSGGSLTTGSANTVVGERALFVNLIGDSNVAVGNEALRASVSGSNTAVGFQALFAATSGPDNIAVGNQAGAGLTTGSHNIYIGAPAGGAAEAFITRIGKATQSRAFIGGIRGITTLNGNAIPVVIDSAGQLGTVSSSRRFKEDIADLGPISLKVQQLRPVQFRYTQAFADGGKPLQYGLIAEEVNEVLPELAVRGADGQIETVAYQVLPTLLLAEVQRLERERTALTDQVGRQAEQMAQQRLEIAALKAIVEALAQKQ